MTQIGKRLNFCKLSISIIERDRSVFECLIRKLTRSLPNLCGADGMGFSDGHGPGADSELFKAGVDFHGVHDWSVFVTERSYFGTLALRLRTLTPP